jgi:XTP/dITP diphosphohydrolase
MGRLVVATGNPGKLAEFQQLLGGCGVELEGLDLSVAEDADTYAGNARLKAEAARDASGLPALGDDSGLEVDALDGYPGLRSARVASSQPDRNRLLLARLAAEPRPWRARFICALALAVPDRPTRVFHGVREGEVVEPRDRGSGFGYDPLFLVPEVGLTFAEMEPAQKHHWSHRGASVRALIESGALGRL